MPLVETMTPNPLNPYALQKYVGEQYARMFHRLFAMQTITLALLWRVRSADAE